MYLGFDFFRDNSIKDLEERVRRINEFLISSKDPSHRHFSIFLLSPKCSTKTCTTSCDVFISKKQSCSDYVLCVEFFEPGTNNAKPELEILYRLGKTPELYDSMKKDVQLVSFLCAYPEHEEAEFKISEHSFSILFQFKDDDPVIQLIQNHISILRS